MEGWEKTEIGLMTQDWQIIELGDVCDFVRGPFGGSLKKEIFVDRGIAVYEQSHAIHGDLKNFRYFIDEMKFHEMQRFEVKAGDIIMSCSGTFGKVRVIPDSFIRGIINQALLKLTPKKIFTPFLKYLFNSSILQLQLSNNTLGVAIKNVASVSVLKKLLIPYPSYLEQRKIAYVLSTVQKAIEQQDKLIKTTTELKKSLMQKLFTEGLYGDQKIITDFGFSPESWKIQPFENTGEVVYGIQAAVAKNLKPIGSKILTNKNITLDGRITLEKLNYFELSTKRHFQTILKKGDLLFNWRSGSKEHVGKTALFNLEDGEYTHSSFILRIRVNEKHSNIFLYYYLNFLRESAYYQKVQTYSINAKFNKSAINAMPIALPEKSEQIEIAKILTAIDKKLDNLYQKKKVAHDLFKTLLHELMTGQRRVNEIDFENNKEELLKAAEPEIKYNE